MKTNWKIGLAIFLVMAAVTTSVFADKNGDLVYAAYSGDTARVKSLLESGADVNAKGNGGWTPLAYAANSGNLEMAKILIENGADINAKTNDGWTVLRLASSRNHGEVIKLLMRNGAFTKPEFEKPDYGTTLTKQPAAGHDGFAIKSCSPDDRSGWDVAKLDTARNVDYLSELEKDVILELNMARSNPKKYAEMYIQPIIDSYEPDGTRYRNGINILIKAREPLAAEKECLEVMKETSPMDILTPSKGITLAARWQSETKGEIGETGHKGIDGSSPTDRVNRYGVSSGAAECLDYGPNVARNIVSKLLIDAGTQSRGHRKIILTPSYKRVGVGFASHTKSKYMLTLDFCDLYYDTE